MGIVVPLLPVYAHQLGATGIYIGLLFGSFSLSRTIFLPYFGRQSDKTGRKPYIVAGLLGYSIISIVFIFSTSVNMLIFIRFIQGVASAMIMPVVQAYVGDITPRNKEGMTMGIFNMSVFLGLSFGPLLGGAIKDQLGLDFAFGCMGSLSFIGFVLSLFYLPPVQSEKIIFHTKPLVPWKILITDKELVGLFIFRLCYTSCIGMIWAFLPVFTEKEFSFSSTIIGFLVMLGVFTGGIVQTPMGMLADRINRRFMILVGGLMLSVSMIVFKWSNHFWDVFIADILFGLGGGMSMAALMALVVRNGNRNDSMGAVMGLMTMAHSTGMLIGSLVAGVIMDIFELRQAFAFGSLLMLIGTLLYFVSSYRYKKSPEWAVSREK